MFSPRLPLRRVRHHRVVLQQLYAHDRYGDSPYIAVPAFLSRAFRHSSFYIRTDRGIRLAGRSRRAARSGVPEYQMTAALWLRGMLQEDYSVKPTDIHWRTGRTRAAGRAKSACRSTFAGLDLAADPGGKTLSACCRRARSTPCCRQGRLRCFCGARRTSTAFFPIYKEVEQSYYKKTGYFPIMHLVPCAAASGAEVSVAAGEPYKALLESKSHRPRKTLQSRAARGRAALDGGRGGGTKALMGADYLALRREGLPATRSR